MGRCGVGGCTIGVYKRLRHQHAPAPKELRGQCLWRAEIRGEDLAWSVFVFETGWTVRRCAGGRVSRVVQQLMRKVAREEVRVVIRNQKKKETSTVTSLLHAAKDAKDGDYERGEVLTEFNVVGPARATESVVDAERESEEGIPGRTWRARLSCGAAGERAAAERETWGWNTGRRLRGRRKEERLAAFRRERTTAGGVGAGSGGAWAADTDGREAGNRMAGVLCRLDVVATGGVRVSNGSEWGRESGGRDGTAANWGGARTQRGRRRVWWWLGSNRARWEARHVVMAGRTGGTPVERGTRSTNGNVGEVPGKWSTVSAPGSVVPAE
ncbi:hypothetical protein B0H16DRAFT_1478692 [Mycena metata]|uniref:Uncharacterized protein n=1 Tax=Mycena metata TaxID=1033252 RepID=A0AAD7H646_9AGAR|nr:hypothetical protein B0H16DRAFT_1478692 [Mycena metata]